MTGTFIIIPKYLVPKVFCYLFYRVVIVLLLLIVSATPEAFADNPLSKYMSGDYPHPTSRYTCLMDLNTGKVLYSKNPYTHRSPASLTKMVAAIVLIENGHLNDTVTAPPAVVGTPESSLHLSPGETISLRDLLYAMLLRSANDTPVVGAYYLSGGISPFVDLMNNKAKEIGCQNTHFVTPNGLYANGHYSCAYDLALIARYGLTHLPEFREIVKTREYHVKRSIHTGDSLVTNTAMTFLTDYPGADGVKTGYISQAGHCFVGSATHHGWQLIAVSLNSPQCRSDVVQMLSYGFANFKPRMIFKAGYPAGTLTLNGRPALVVTGGDLDDVVGRKEREAPLTSYSLRAQSFASADALPISIGEKVGTVSLYRDGIFIMKVDALAANPVPARPSLNLPQIGWWGKSDHVVIATVLTLVLLPLLYVGGRILELALHARKTAENSRRRRSSITKDVRAVDS